MNVLISTQNKGVVQIPQDKFWELLQLLRESSTKNFSPESLPSIYSAESAEDEDTEATWLRFDDSTPGVCLSPNSWSIQREEQHPWIMLSSQKWLVFKDEGLFTRWVGLVQAAYFQSAMSGHEYTPKDPRHYPTLKAGGQNRRPSTLRIHMPEKKIDVSLELSQSGYSVLSAI